MNWLAHLYLSEPSPAFRIGNLLPDLVSITALTALPAEYQGGIQQHRQIDAFTDAHHIFRRSIQRLGPDFRRFGGILVDMFYDHFLCRQWATYSPIPLQEFTADVYASFDQHWSHIPEEAHPHLHGMRKYNWLSSYGDLGELSQTLRRISKRFRRPVDLVPSIAILESAYPDFQADFTAFFPELVQKVSSTKPLIPGVADL